MLLNIKEPGIIQPFTLTIVGVGLISGSFSLALKRMGLVKKVYGVSRSGETAERARQLGIIDEVADLETAIPDSDVIYVAIPVDATLPVMEKIMALLQPHQIVADAGSTKNELCKLLTRHPLRGRFVATHPMWGTEHSGPEAAVADGFSGRSCVICDADKTDADALALVITLYKKLGMNMIEMDAQGHDIHAAYISHISHITSFALANTVLEKEKEEDAIFDMAGGGFESTVRLAKSSPQMWLPIFRQNKENVLDVLNEHITQLRKFKSALEKENWEYLNELMAKANEIKRILK